MNPANRRIAFNTAYMYVRLVTLMAVGLYTSRLVLSVLGVSDYGIFAVVGGVMALFTFLSNALANATSRFLNTEMGRGGDVNATFNINLLLHVALALLIFLLAESVGLWYIHSGLNVAPGRLDDNIVAGLDGGVCGVKIIGLAVVLETDGYNFLHSIPLWGRIERI